MKYYIIAGESSGDLYGSLLMKEIKGCDHKAEFRFWGGDKMLEQSPNMGKHLKDTAFMGFWEVAKNILNIKELFSFAKDDILSSEADVLILIDYPGFNLRIAKWAHSKGIKVCYYISPQLWAWKESRHIILRKCTDLFFVILPFETEFYQNLDTPCIYYGHPLLEVIPEHFPKTNTAKLTTGLFPGSRIQEIDQHLPTMINFAERQKKEKFIIAAVPHIDKNQYLKHFKKYHENIDIHYGHSYEVMRTIDYAISSSGTATLELALHGVPQIVVYKTSAVSFFIGSRLVKTRYISLVNLIAGKQIVKELLQQDFTVSNLEEAYLEMTDQPANVYEEAYAEIRSQLGDGQTSQHIARHIFDFFKTEN